MITRRTSMARAFAAVTMARAEEIRVSASTVCMPSTAQ
jgi:hypothetical protein